MLDVAPERQITSGFGDRTMVDWTCPRAIKAARPGTLVYAVFDTGGYGNTMVAGGNATTATTAVCWCKADSRCWDGSGTNGIRCSQNDPFQRAGFPEWCWISWTPWESTRTHETTPWSGLKVIWVASRVVLVRIRRCTSSMMTPPTFREAAILAWKNELQSCSGKIPAGNHQDSRPEPLCVSQDGDLTGLMYDVQAAEDQHRQGHAGLKDDLEAFAAFQVQEVWSDDQLSSG